MEGRAWPAVVGFATSRILPPRRRSRDGSMEV